MSDSAILELEEGTSAPSAGAAGEHRIYIDPTTKHLVKKKPDGSVFDFEVGGAPPIAADIANTPAGDISATNVQAAINELDAEKAPISHVGASGPGAHPVASGVVAGFMSPSDKSKLDGIAPLATQNDTDANLKNRGNHTGTQLAATISDFTAAAKSAVVDDFINDGVVDKAPSQNSVFDALAIKENLSNKNAANGYAGLDGSAKIPTAILPAAVLGAANFQGTWDAATNSPALASGVGTKGHYYIVNVPGSTNLDGENDWAEKDWAIFDGTNWKKVDNTDKVSSVNSKVGNVVLDTGDIGENGNLYHTVSRARAAAVLNTLAGNETDQAPSVLATKTSIATKLTDPMSADGDLITRIAGVAARRGIGPEATLLRSVGGLPSWEEENLTQDFGDGSDGNLTVSGALTLSQIPYYNVLTINSGAVINTNGYPIYCKVLDLTNAPAGAIHRNGNNGATVSANTGGAGGASLSTAVLGGSGAGSTGAAGATNAGTSSGTPTTINTSNGGAGGGSGASGAGGTGAGAAAGGGGTISAPTHFGRFEYQFLRGATIVSGGAGGDGGNSGGGNGASSSRGAGGGGGGAGILVIYAAEIITGPSTPAGVIQANGGNGGIQTNPPAAGDVGGARGAGGGGGGYVYIAFVKKTGTPIVGLVQANGGNGGNGSNGLGTGLGGNGGNGGNGGRIQTYNVFDNSGQEVVGATGATGTAASGINGGAGGNGGVCELTL